ncbi:hypothetical protein SAMD00019534_020280 [Acytostelium subglobosum LB1]|uniref:hypothetical protein n=1 Tax=Acytostelium subglobosum LB1 TaxID=1410327 RepID=UPI0006452364|nr:hypothetical protein SAMD00019534_020280 [Acytostelium subglobosum LB1]GAM18853.1 hypothetical protein SAMD00019534_020280 [Acytostelium subglobosum LB1]|eukprot:XP_012758073.1 hypothetical protein SAMD00019534_020280 [Acytostelium subglobosum LB1]
MINVENHVINVKDNTNIVVNSTNWIESLYDHIETAQNGGWDDDAASCHIDADTLKRPLHDHLMLSSVFLSRLAYVNYEKDIANMIAQHTTTIPLRSISFYKPTHTRTKMVVALDHLDNMFVAFTGSTAVSDVQLDVACGLFEKQFYDREHTLYATIARFEWVYCAVQQLMTIAYRCKAKRLIFTGHSMGANAASWAAIHALNLQRQSAPSPHLGTLSIKCYSFAAASYFHQETRELIDQLERERPHEPIFTTVLNEFDLVPLMSHHPFLMLDFFFIILAFVSMLHTLLYHREPSMFAPLLLLLAVKLPLSYALAKLVDTLYIKCFSIGLLSPNVHLFNAKENRYIATDPMSVESRFKSLLHHLVKLYNIRALFNQDHSCELYYQRVQSQILCSVSGSAANAASNTQHQQLSTNMAHMSTTTSDTVSSYTDTTSNGNGNGADSSSISNHIQYLTHPAHFVVDIVEDERIALLKKRITMKGLGILMIIHMMWVVLSIIILSF